MKAFERVILFAILALPVFLLGFLTLSPLPKEMLESLRLVRLAESQGRHVEASRELRILLTFQPDRLELWERIAAHEYALEAYDQAIEDYEKAHQAGLISDDGLYSLGEAYKKSGNLERAASTWRELTDRPNIAESFFSLLTANFRESGDFDYALKAAEKWVLQAGRDPEAGFNLGLLLSYRDPAEAIKALRMVSNTRVGPAKTADRLIEVLEVVTASPSRAYGLVLTGQRLGEMGHWDLAEQALIQAVNLEPDYAEAWAMLSETQQNQGQDGFSALQRAAQLSPASDYVRIAQVLYWRRQNQPEVALSYLRSLADKYPQEGRWQTEIGAILAEGGDLIEAMRAYQQAIEIEPENASLWSAVAVFSAANGFDPESYTLPAISKALELDPDGLVTVAAAGWVYLALDRLDEAEQFLQQALAIDAAYPPAVLHLGQVYLEKKRMNEAYPLISRAALQTSDAQVASQAQRVLEQYFPSRP